MKFLKESSKSLSKEVLRASVSLWLMVASVFSVIFFDNNKFHGKQGGY